MSISLSIAEPCHENWSNMLPEQQGKFCLSCQKTVTDFTNMTDVEVLRYFEGYQGNTCGRFTDDQLERKITEPKKHSIGKWKYFWQILIPAMFMVHRAEAQAKKGEVTAICNNKPLLGEPVVMGKVAYRSPIASLPAKKIQLQIIDETGKQIPFATIHLLSKNQMISADGMGRLDVSAHLNETVEISSVGFKTQTTILKTGVVYDLIVVLQKKEDSLMDVKVIGYGGLSCRMGGISVVTKTYFFNKKKDTIPTIEPSLKIFPNPVRANQSFKMALSVNKTGKYLLQLINVSGQIIKQQTIDMQLLQQTETIDGIGLQQPGIYIVHVTSGEDKSVFNGKLVIE